MIGGTLGEVSGEKIHKVLDLATSLGVPLVGINDGGGARVQEGVGRRCTITAGYSGATWPPPAWSRR